MKMTHELSTVDRVSTHEELHQVLALLNESADRVTTEAARESDEESALQDAVANLWQDGGSDEPTGDLEGDVYSWAEFADKTERVN